MKKTSKIIYMPLFSPIQKTLRLIYKSNHIVKLGCVSLNF